MEELERELNRWIPPSSNESEEEEKETTKRTPATEEEYLNARKYILDLVNMVDTETAKFTLGILSTTKDEQVVALCRDFKRPLERYAEAIRGIARFTRTRTLREYVLNEARQLLHATIALVKHALNATKDSIEPSIAGHIFACCKKHINIPKTDKIAVKRAVFKATLLIKDTADEFAECLHEAEETNDGEEDSIAFLGDDMFGGGDDDDDEDMTDAERTVVAAAVGLLRRCQRLCKACANSMTMLSSKPSESVSRAIDRIATETTTVAARVTDLGCGLYTPIERSGCRDIRKGTDAVVRCVAEIETNLLVLPPLRTPEQRTAVKKIADGLRTQANVLLSCDLLKGATEEDTDAAAAAVVEK